MARWLEVVAVSSFHLWRDQPAATSLTLACTAGELEALILALTTTVMENKQHKPLLAEVRTRRGEVRSVNLHMTVVSPSTDPAKLHTGNGVGDWIKVGEKIRLIAFD